MIVIFKICHNFFFLSAGSAARRNKGGVSVSVTDRASVYLELAEAYRATDAQVMLQGFSNLDLLKSLSAVLNFSCKLII